MRHFFTLKKTGYGFFRVFLLDENTITYQKGLPRCEIKYNFFTISKQARRTSDSA